MGMTDNSNIHRIGRERLDRLSDLPINIIHKIQDHVSIEDAARMSVLSQTWRYIWASNPNLVFDTNFCTKRLPANTIDIISTVLFQHYGSIKTFLVDISSIHSSQYPVVDRWMLYLSRNGLIDVIIKNHNDGNAPYTLPSYVYEMGLECLSLTNCIFRPPCSFTGFHKLKVFKLLRVSFELNLSTSSSLRMPNIEILVFKQCVGVRFLNIHAPKVAVLCLFYCGIDTLNLSPFMNSEKMRLFAIVSEKQVSLNSQDKAMKLTDLLSSWPNLDRLVLSSNILNFIATAAESPPMQLTRLRVLCLSEYVFGNEDQRFALSSILRSSPNLMLLQFHTMMIQNNKGEIEVDVNYCQVQPEYKIQQLKNLQTLKLSRLYGKRHELLFIKFILASAPVLEKAILLVDTSVDQSQSLNITKELMRFPRASPKLEIIYESWSIERASL